MAEISRFYDSSVARNNYAVTYGYDTDGRFNNISWAIGNNTGTATYVFVPDSELLESLTVNNGGVDYTASYDYEEKRHLKTQVLNEYGTTVISQYDYPSNDDLGRRVAIKTTGTAFSLSVSINVNPEESIYTVNSLNQYSQINTQKTQEVVADTFSYDDDGNLINWTKGVKSMHYKYDAENRLVSVAPESPSSGDKRLEFVYDYMGRRVLKKISEYSSGSWQPQKEILFVYDGWNLIEEITRIGESDASRYFVWGLDLSQSLQGAGGIGGLIASVDAAASKTWYYAYDANGNVGQMVDASDGSIDAHYVYDPYGNIIGSSGVMADENPIRFSTKYFDVETGLGYWGYRYYSPELGRWINRDPIAEEGGLNLYGFIGNDPIDNFDLFGLIFGITYVRFDSLTGHAWIRTGELVDVTINAGPTETVNIGGKKHRLIRLHAKLPEGYGFYPAENINKSNPIDLFGFHKGKWVPEHDPKVGKEFMVAFNKLSLIGWETELKKLHAKAGRFIEATFTYGKAKGKCCKNATKEKVLNCLESFINDKSPPKYQFPFSQCRARAKDALDACCLKIGDKMGTVPTGKIRAEYDPTPLTALTPLP